MFRPMMTIIERLYFILLLKNIVALDGIQSKSLAYFPYFEK
jgi:hypothetical protein